MSNKAKKHSSNRAAIQNRAPAPETQPGTSVATVQTAVGAKAALPPGIVIKRRITMPSLVMKKAGQTLFLNIVDAMRVSTVKDKPTTDGKAKEPATICTAGDILTGEMFTFLVPSVVRENLRRDYPGDSYVGKCFMIENKGKRTEGQRYWDFAISEIDATGLTAAAQEAESLAAANRAEAD